MQQTVHAWFTKICWLDQVLSLLINLIAAMVAFLLGVFFHAIPKSRRDYEATRFWGKSPVAICHGTVQINPSLDRSKFNLFLKINSDKKVRPVTGPHDNVIGEAEMRCISYTVAVLSNLGRQWSVLPELAALNSLDLGTILVIGSPSSNELADFVLKHQEMIRFERSGDHSVKIVVKGNDEPFDSYFDTERDHGVIIRFKNPWDKQSYIFVCAGLGEWGSSGACYYLWKHWQDIHHEFRSDFAIVLEVKTRSDHSAIRVYPPQD